MRIIEIYTDGSCTPNPGLGTCAFLVTKDSKTTHCVEGFRFDGEVSTNNRMELMAVTKAMEWIGQHAKTDRVYIHMDSQYVQLGLTQWLEGWKRKNWKTAGKKDVANADLWEKLDRLKSALPNVQFQWVRGHNNNKFNTMVDQHCSAMYKV